MDKLLFERKGANPVHVDDISELEEQLPGVFGTIRRGREGGGRIGIKIFRY